MKTSCWFCSKEGLHHEFQIYDEANERFFCNGFCEEAFEESVLCQKGFELMRDDLPVFRQTVQKR